MGPLLLLPIMTPPLPPPPLRKWISAMSTSNHSESRFPPLSDMLPQIYEQILLQFVLEGEVMISFGEESGPLYADITKAMKPSLSTCHIKLQNEEEILVHKGLSHNSQSENQSLGFRSPDRAKRSVRSHAERERTAGRAEERVEITDLAPEVVRGLLHWLYTARIPTPIQAQVSPSPSTAKTGVIRQPKCLILDRENPK